MNAKDLESDPERVDMLLERQAALQLQAGNIIDELGLIRLLTAFGHAELVGSVATGLMAWRDIDIHVLCNVSSLNPQRVHAALNPLASHPNVKRMTFHNHSGPFRAPEFPDGLYYGIHYFEGGTSEGERWKIDCWFLPSDSPRPEFVLIDRMRRELTDETRLAILWIKETWHSLPAYRYTVSSIDIYTAVLDHGVRTPDEFEEWLRARRSN